jgi:hypothetical protein
MRNAVAPLFFRAIIALILGMVVLVVFVRGAEEAVYGACWDKTKYNFVNLREGENKIELGDCIDKVYIATKDQLETLKGDVNIYSCSHRNEDEYLSFAVIKPKKDVSVKQIIESGGKKITQNLLETYCVDYRYKFNTITGPRILEGKKTYCIKMDRVSGSANPEVDKYLNIREGGC